MKVIRAEVMGFCAGVRRAVNTANKALQDNKSGQVYTYGPLIHNPVALNDFENRGLRVLCESKINELKSGDTVVVRAHGITPEVYEKLEATGADVLNGTCPLVQQSQKRAADYASRGYKIIFAGDSGHGEVVGIEGAAKKAASENNNDFDFNLVKNTEELNELLKMSSDKPVVLLSQTTFSIRMFDELSSLLKNVVPECEIIESICPATHERQESLVKLCKEVDGVLVIGGKNSANTTRLYNTASSLCKDAALIENASEIPERFFGYKTTGLTAGASTPDDVIDSVEKRLQTGL